MKKISFPILLLGFLFFAGCTNEAVEFNDTLVSASNQCETVLANMYDDTTINDQTLESVLEICQNSLHTVENIDMVEGGEEFKEIIMRYISVEIEYIEDLKKIYPFLQKEDFTEDDMLQYQSLADKLTEYENLIDEKFSKIEEAQKKFADKNHIILSGETQDLTVE